MYHQQQGTLLPKLNFFTWYMPKTFQWKSKKKNFVVCDCCAPQCFGMVAVGIWHLTIQQSTIENTKVSAASKSFIKRKDSISSVVCWIVAFRTKARTQKSNYIFISTKKEANPNTIYWQVRKKEKKKLQGKRMIEIYGLSLCVCCVCLCVPYGKGAAAVVVVVCFRFWKVMFSFCTTVWNNEPFVIRSFISELCCFNFLLCEALCVCVSSLELTRQVCLCFSGA